VNVPALRRLAARVVLAVAPLAAVTASLAPAEALAQAANRAERRVVILIDPSGMGFLARVRAEVESLGLVVVERDFKGPLEQAARLNHAVAAIRLLPTRNGVEIWMADETSGRSLLRQVIVDESPNGPDEGLVALQTAELMRTSLLLDDVSEPRPTEAPPPPDPPAAKAESTPPPDAAGIRGAGLQTALGALYSPGGASTALQLWVSLHAPLAQRFGLSLDLSAPLAPATISGPEGSADVGVYLAAVALFGRLQSSESSFFTTVGLGAGAARLSADGRSEPPLVAASVSQVTAIAYTRVDVGYALTPWLRLGGRGVFGGALDRVALRFAGNEAGSWGPAFFGALALAEVRWQ
jgi:hypothetical protein